MVINILIIKILSPMPKIILNGLMLKEVMPSDAEINHFFNGYFDFPANLSFLS